MGKKPTKRARSTANYSKRQFKRKTSKTLKKPVNRASKEILYLTEPEFERLLSVISSKRDLCMFTLAKCRGLRASELGKIQMADVFLAAKRIYVHRLKGSHSGEFLLSDRELASIRAWIRERGKAPGALFPSRCHNPISRRRLHDMMKHYGALAGIPPAKRHMHVLKHTCATHLLAREGDITLVQDHLGHVNIQSTMVYSHVTNRKRDELGERLRRDW